MIRIVMIAPYEGSKAIMEEVISGYVASEPISVTVHSMTLEQIAQASMNGDVILARGYNMTLIKQRCKDIPVIPLDISGYDIIRAVHAAIHTYHPGKIAFIGPAEMVQSAENIGGILGVEVCSYQSARDNIPAVIDQARADGCDCFVGGLSVIEQCSADTPHVLVETGRSTIVTSLDEAVRTVRLLREQQEKTIRHKTLMDYSKEGMLFLSESGKIISLNRVAQRYLSIGINSIGKPAEEQLPFLWPMIQQALRVGEKIENEVCSYGDQLLTLDYIPIRQGREISGLVVFIRSVDRIQKEEALIRKKIQGKGQKAKYHFENIIYSSELFEQTVQRAKLYAKVDSPVLIVGESGTGKELIAQSIHNESPRRGGPFIAINCASLPESLLESELFGYSDGAFTGALKGGKEGLFEAAHGGTLFLDEISEIPISFQSKLLRVLQENEVRRIGSQKIWSIDVRIIAATNRNLKLQVKKGLFRQDLLFRLNVLYLYIPPLRQRPTDIVELFGSFLREYSVRYHKDISVITGEANELLVHYSWAGNTREVKNVAERICVLTSGNVVDGEIVRSILYEDDGMELPSPGAELEYEQVEDEESLIRLLLKRNGGKKEKVAHLLEIDRTTLWRKMKKYGIE